MASTPDTRNGDANDQRGKPAYDGLTALVVVDMQNDFAHPGGSLHVTGGEDLVGPIGAEMESADAGGATVVVTQDWHPEATPHFVTDGGVWPVHCVGGTWGAELIDGLRPHADAVIRKGVNGEDGYSAFTMRDPTTNQDAPTGLAGLLRDRGVKKVSVVGIATDVCVLATALDAAASGFDTTVIWDLTRPVHDDSGTADRVAGELADGGVSVLRR
jgi:nicotinamidase/pyrazinamidase